MFKWEMYAKRKFWMNLIAFLPITICYTIFCWCTPAVVSQCAGKLGESIVDCAHKRNTGHTALFVAWGFNFISILKEIRYQ